MHPRVCFPVILLIFLVLFARVAEGEEGFVPLFNGKDLSGWVNVSCDESTWIFDEDGLLICTGIPTGEIRTERMYQNFILELEWRHLVPKGNAGVFVWADDITARGTPFIRSIEIQVLENAYGNTKYYSTHGDIFPIQGATMEPTNGRDSMRSFPTELLSNPAPQWNHYRIECQDGTVKLSVNGTKVNEGRESVPRKGYICLESEGGVVQYRNVRVKERPDTPVAPEHVAIADRGFKNLYTGVDLSGWNSSGGWVAKDWILAHPDSAEKAGILETEATYEAIGFVFDFCFHSDSTALSFFPRGRDGASITFSPGDERLEKAEEWNRIEGEIRDGKLAYSINGKDAAEILEGLPASGPLAFSTDGLLEMSNFYVRTHPEEN